MTPPVPPIVPLTTELSTLEASCTGRILRAGDPRIATFLGAPDDAGRLDGALVVLADCVHDVGAAVRFAGRAGVATVVVGGAQGSMPVPPDAVVIVVEGIRGVDVDPTTATARVGVGARWDAVRDAARPLGIGGLAGAPPDGVVGSTLAIGSGSDGAGAGPAAVADVVGSVVAAQVVDAAGRARFRTDLTGSALLAAARDEGQIVTAVDLRLR